MIRGYFLNNRVSHPLGSGLTSFFIKSVSIKTAKKMVQRHSFSIDIDYISFSAIADGDLFHINVWVMFF